MKIYCSKCNNDISKIIDTHFEVYQVGCPVCTNCKTAQKRYISESDLLLYLLGLEILYIIITIAVGYAFDSFNIFLVILAVILLGVVLFLQKNFSRYIYTKPPYKKAYMTTNYGEDSSKVRRGINIQFSIFILLAFVSIIYKPYRLDLLGLLAIDIIISILRYILAIRKEINK